MTEKIFMSTDRLNKVKIFYQKYKRLPSYAEMLQLFNLSSKNAIFKIVKKWTEQNILSKVNNKLAPGREFFKLALVGSVAAGFPTTSEETFDFVSLDEYLVDKPQSSFLLKVTGESLKDIGILAGDIVVIERKKEAYNGQIVLALIDNEWTLKIFQKKAQEVWLVSANDKFPNFKPSFDLQIYGVVKSVMRKI